MIDVEVRQGDLLDGIENEVDDVVLGNPFTQVAGQKHRRVAVQINESCRHDSWNRTASLLFKVF